MLHDTARAKLNLTLEVRGRHPDGFHELESLVAFADFGDAVELEPGEDLDLVIDGPFAQGLSTGANLILEAAKAAKAMCPDLALGRFRLTKELPIAAGLGGGSADAAAALRLIARANQGKLSPDVLKDIAAKLGSDVTACLKSKPALMTGRGEQVSEISGFPVCGVLLANPGVELSTAKVYAALDAALLGAMPASTDLAQFDGDFERLIEYARARPNDLEAPVLRLAPIIGDVLAALVGLDGVRLARLSGSVISR